MPCRVPPTSKAAFAEASRKWPGRRTSSDGTCPGGAHHQASPNSDHEPDWRVLFYSCAFDLSHDPAHGVNAPAIGDQIKRDRRVKYVIRHNYAVGYDEIWNNEQGDQHWRDAHQSPPDKHAQGGGHLHVSLWHKLGVLNDAGPWFGAAPVPPPVEDDDMREEIWLPDAPIPDGEWKGKKPSCSVFVTSNGDPFMAFQLSEDELDTANKRHLPLVKKPAVLFVNLAIRPWQPAPE